LAPSWAHFCQLDDIFCLRYNFDQKWLKNSINLAQYFCLNLIGYLLSVTDLQKGYILVDFWTDWIDFYHKTSHVSF
jgi:hypothetical protein